jgi:hypothetical protein
MALLFLILLDVLLKTRELISCFLKIPTDFIILSFNLPLINVVFVCGTVFNANLQRMFENWGKFLDYTILQNHSLL